MDDLGTYRARIGLFSFSTQKALFKPKPTINRKNLGCLNVTGSFFSDAYFQIPFSISLFICNFLIAVVLSLELAGLISDHIIINQTGSGNLSFEECRYILTVMEGCVIASFLCHYLLGNKGVHVYNGNPNPKSKQRDKLFPDCATLPPRVLHNEMLTLLSKQLHPGITSLWKSFKASLKWKTDLPKEVISEAVDIIGICDHLLDKGDIKIGCYDKLRQCFDGNSKCIDILDSYEPKIKTLILKPNSVSSTLKENSRPENVRLEGNICEPVAIMTPNGKIQHNWTDPEDTKFRTAGPEESLQINQDDSKHATIKELKGEEFVKRRRPGCRDGHYIDDSVQNVLQQHINLFFRSRDGICIIGDGNSVDTGNHQIRETIQEEASNIKHSIKSSTKAMQRNIDRQSEAIEQTMKILEHSNGSKFQNIVGQTEAWIAYQQKNPFVKTKAFADAKSKLLGNKLVVIKGNTGDGKTKMAAELLHWLMGGDSCPPKKAVHLKDLKAWDDVISPKSCLAILIDDVLRYTSELKENDIEWKKIETFITPVLDGKIQESSNCIIITVRNDIFEEHKSLLSDQKIFNEQNIVDLSSADYSLKGEKKQILNLYTPSSNFKPFSEEEIESIITNSPNIGFPECCRIFMNTPDLHRERASFFGNPLRYMKNIIKLKFGADRQVALFYLLLTGGNIHRDQFDPGNESVNQQRIQKYLDISFMCIMQKNQGLSFSEKRKCLQQGLESLCGSFVKLEKDVYNFFHDSIHDAVAILYGEISPQGFLKNCDSSCLRYIVTRMMRNITCKCVIEKRNFRFLYERILSDLKFEDAFKYRAIASLMPWYDEEFLSGFFKWIGSKSDVPDDFSHMFKAKYSFFIYVVKMNNTVLLKYLIERSTNGIGMKHALDVALSAGKVECASLLLNSEFVKPDDNSCFAVIQSGKIELLHKLNRYGIIQKATAKRSKTHYVVRSLNILHEACLFQREDMVDYLLKLYPSLLQETTENGYSTLHLIATTGNFSLYKTVEKLMLSHKSNREAQQYTNELKTADQETVLHMACRSGKTELCLYLCKHFPSLLQCKDAVGYHCLHYVAMSGNAICYKEVEAIVMADKTHRESEDFMESISNSETKTVLYWACISGSKDLCLHLCQKYPFLMANRGWQGRHCLHIIARSNDLKWYQAGESLVLKGMTKAESEHFIENLKDGIGGNLLHNACGSGSTDISAYLCRNNKKLLDDTNKDGWHCLHYAVVSGKIECYKTVENFVLEGKSETDSLQYIKQLVDKDDMNVLHRACLLRKNDLCLYLCDKYPDLFSERGKQNWHCLHFLAYLFDMDWYEALLQGGSSANAEYIKSLLTADGLSVKDIVKTTGKKTKNALCEYLIQQNKICGKRKD